MVADYSARPAATVSGLLAFLDAAMDVEHGLAPAEVAVAKDRVQILTVHAAKGLEWQVVAVPHLSGRVFPSTASRRTWLTDAADLPPLLRGDRATVSEHGVPVLDTSDVNDRKALSDKLDEHKRNLDQRQLDEERRLLYVAVTRAEDTLLLSGHHWGATEAKPRGPSDFLLEIKDVIDRRRPQRVSRAGSSSSGRPNPRTASESHARRGDRAHLAREAAAADRSAVDRGAALVARAMAAAGPPTCWTPEGLAADVDALLAERARARNKPPVALPPQLSVSALVDIGRNPDGAAARLQRRLPVRPDPHALLGTAFHDWVQRFFRAERLFDLEDLPGAVDGELGRADAELLADLQAAFAVSPWSARTPLDVEVPFDMMIGDTVVRGRIDAVFADSDGGFTVVDWKTGDPPRPRKHCSTTQFSSRIYRLAWAATHGFRPRRCARCSTTWQRPHGNPAILPGLDELVQLLAASRLTRSVAIHLQAPT